MPDEGVQVQGPDGRKYAFPKGTTKEAAIGYFKKKGISAPAKKEPTRPKDAITAASETTKEFMKGVGGGALELGTSLSPLINKIPGIGETLAPKAGIEAAHKIAESKNTAQSVGKTVEGVGEFALGESALAGKAAKILPMLTKAIGSARAAKIFAGMVTAGTVGTATSAGHGEENPLRSGALTAVTAGLGEYISKPLSELAGKALPRAYNAMNKYLGLNMSDLPKWQRFNVGSAESVGKTVLEQVGIKPTLEAQHAAIEQTKNFLVTQTEQELKSVPSRNVPIDSIIKNARDDVAKQIRDNGTDYVSRTAALDKQVDEMRTLLFGKVQNPQITAAKALELRRNLRPNFTTAPMGTLPGVDDLLHTRMYEALNDHIERSLPTDSAALFKKNNATVHRLILGRDAAAEKLNKAAVDKSKGIASRVASAAVGAAGGAYVGSKAGHTTEGALIGAAAGAGLGGHDVNLPRADIATQKAIAKLAPKLASMASKGSASAARALEIITSKKPSSGSMNPNP